MLGGQEESCLEDGVIAGRGLGVDGLADGLQTSGWRCEVEVRVGMELITG